MLSDLLTLAIAMAGAFVLYRYRRRIWSALVAFDLKNRAKAEQEQRDRRDPVAHIRHTFAVADEQVEEIGELTLWDVSAGKPVTRYLFEGRRYASRDEAEVARARKVGGKARAFYTELPAALSARKDEPTED